MCGREAPRGESSLLAVSMPASRWANMLEICESRVPWQGVTNELRTISGQHATAASLDGSREQLQQFLSSHHNMLRWAPEGVHLPSIAGTSRPFYGGLPFEPSTRTQDPIVTGAGIVACKFDNGVLIAADTLGSYGTLARFKDVKRVGAYGSNTIVGAAGDLSDFQAIKDQLDEAVTDELMYDDGNTTTPSQMHSYLVSTMYQRRNKGDPLWNEVFVGGREAGRSFLGSVDMRGTSFVDNFMANGFALHVAIPILRRRWRPDMTQAEATTLLETCLTTQWYMHTKGYCRIQIAAVTDAGCTVSEPYEITQQWGYKGFENTAYCGLQKPLHS